MMNEEGIIQACDAKLLYLNKTTEKKTFYCLYKYSFTKSNFFYDIGQVSE